MKGLVWYVKKFELHPESHGKELKELKQGNGLIGSAFLENIFWQQREGGIVWRWPSQL